MLYNAVGTLGLVSIGGFSDENHELERKRVDQMQTQWILEIPGRRKARCAVLSGDQGPVSAENAGVSAILESSEAQQLLRDAGAGQTSASLLPVRAGD